jgi:hypothetical protein
LTLKSELLHEVAPMSNRTRGVRRRAMKSTVPRISTRRMLLSPKS